MVTSDDDDIGPITSCSLGSSSSEDGRHLFENLRSCVWTCMDICMDMCIDTCMGMCMDMCMDVNADMCVDMCTDECEHEHVYRPAYGRVCACVRAFVCIQT